MKNDQERRVILAIALSVVVLMGWQWLFPPPAPPEVTEEGTTEAPSADDTPTAVPVAAAPPAQEQVAASRKGMSLDFGSAEVRSENGALQVVTLNDYEEAVQVTPIWNYALASVFGGDAAEGDDGWQPYRGGDGLRQVITADGALVLAGAGALDDDGAGESGGPSVYRVSESGEGITATRRRSDGLVITKTYTPGEHPYTVDVNVTFDNRSSSSLGPVWVGVAERMSGSVGSMFDRSANVTHPQAYIDGIEAVSSPDEVEGAEVERFEGEVSWLGVADRYFLAAIQLPEPTAGVVVMDQLPGGRLGSFYLDSATLDAGASRTLSFTAFVGPKKLEDLRAVGPNLEYAVEYGWFGFFSKILLLCLEFFHAGVGNWGAAIVLLTLTVKLLFFRLNERALSSGEKMKKLQPELEALREKYKDDPQLQSQETMKLWQKHGVSPLGGCGPMLVQMPIFFALYTVMYYSVELYDAQFLYLQDLTATDPYGVVPTMYAVLMIAQQAMMPTANMDPTQARMMKMMPLFFAFIMFSFPSGLVLYFCINILLTIAQQWIIRRRLAAQSAAA